MSCEHKEFRVIVDINKIVKEDSPHEQVAVVSEFAIFCKDCRMPFRFNWIDEADPNEVPLSTSMMLRRPWTTVFGDTLCCTIEPFPEGKWFGENEQVGHA